MAYFYRKLWAVLAAALVLLLALAWPTARMMVHECGGCSAKIICSAVFVSHRSASSVDLSLECGSPLVPMISSYTVNHTSQTVTTSVLGGLLQRTAHYTGVFRGCSLVGASAAVTRDNEPTTARASVPHDKQWPHGRRVTIEDEALFDRIHHALHNFTATPDQFNTRAIVVVHRDRIVYEHYKDGFAPDMPQLGWSMTKSVLQAVIGRHMHLSSLKPQQKACDLLHEWRNENRSAITIDDLLRMSSGLEFVESYDIFSTDVVPMLFMHDDAPTRPLAKPLLHAPASHWSYSSGTSNVLSLLLRRSIADDEKYWSFPALQVFDKIGAESFVMEVDPSGYFVGSSFSFATPRDWARFGLLYLHDGVWQGERLLPEGYIEYTRRPTPNSAQLYGAHWWLAGRAIVEEVRDEKLMPRAVGYRGVPPDSFYAHGYGHQLCFVVPSRDLVIVRLGWTPLHLEFPDQAFVHAILRAMPQ